VSEQTVYRHFPIKDALLEACWTHVQQTLGIELSTRSWKDFVATRPGPSPRWIGTSSCCAR